MTPLEKDLLAALKAAAEVLEPGSHEILTKIRAVIAQAELPPRDIKLVDENGLTVGSVVRTERHGWMCSNSKAFAEDTYLPNMYGMLDSCHSDPDRLRVVRLFVRRGYWAVFAESTLADAPPA